jgi:hypothetical protein
MIYRATVPPVGATCSTETCGTVARVRVTVPRSRFDATGADNSDTWDSCDLHWPAFRDMIMRNGHQVADDTGDWRQILSDYPGWRIFRSDMGRLYAVRPGITVYGWLTAHLRAEILAAQVTALDTGGSRAEMSSVRRHEPRRAKITAARWSGRLG